MSDNVKYWIELSDYDLKTAEAMLLSQRYLYVGFMSPGNREDFEGIFCTD